MALGSGALASSANAGQQAEAALGSWSDGDAKREILGFVAAVTDAASPDYVPSAERIAVFDNDGTLWAEKPLMPEVQFALARLQALAPKHPEWSTTEPFRSALSGDMAALASQGIPALLQIVVTTQAGTTIEEFRHEVAAWLATARHPRLDRPVVACVYKPMLEVIEFLRRSEFQIFIVSGGGAEFIRTWAGDVYRLPPERVVASTLELVYRESGGGRVDLVQEPKVQALVDGPEKAKAIAAVLGQRPIMAFGNSDGDYEMLHYTTAGPGRRLGVLIHHDDAAREYAYDKDVAVGRLVRGLADAPRLGWRLVSMREDWTSVFG